MIKGIHHINIVVTDLEKAVEFFEILGFSVFERKDLTGKWIDDVTCLDRVTALYAGLHHNAFDTNIELLKYIHPEGDKFGLLSKANSIGIRHFAFQVQHIEDEIEKLEDHGAELFGTLQINPYGKKMVYVKGPDGIIVEFAEFSGRD